MQRFNAGIQQTTTQQTRLTKGNFRGQDLSSQFKSLILEREKLADTFYM